MPPRYADPCAGHEPLVFERGVCFHCGRYLASTIGAFEEASESIGYGALAIALERKGEEIRREAQDAGYLDTPERYLKWLESRMRAMDAKDARDRRPRPRVASPA
jgi:hypothetical protein